MKIDLQKSFWKSLSLLFLFTLLLGCASTPPPPKKKEKPKIPLVHFIILHTNDFHGQMLPKMIKKGKNTIVVGGAPNLAAYIKKVRKTAEKEGAQVMLLDAGDCYQGTPEGNLTKGRMVIDYMNYIQYEAMTIGNHEYDFSEKNLIALSRLSNFPFLSSNLFRKKDFQPVSYAKPYIFLKKKGFTFAIVGLTTQDLYKVAAEKFVSHLMVMPEIPTARKIRDQVALQKPDFIIFLTHIGFEADQELAKNVKGIDLIIGGHSHTRLTKPRIFGKCWVVQAHDKGKAIGRIDLWFNKKTHQLVKRKYQLISIPQPGLKPDRETLKIIGEFSPAIEKIMNRVIGFLKKPLKRVGGTNSSPLGNLFADAMREASGAQIAFQNKGGIRDNLPAGKIRYRQVFQVAPFDNTLVLMKLKGSEILELFKKGFQFKEVLEVSGAKCYYRIRPNGKIEIYQVMIGNQLLEKDKEYVVVTNSFLADGGDGFSTFKHGRQRTLMGISYRKALEDYLRNHSPLDYQYENRYYSEKVEKGLKK